MAFQKEIIISQCVLDGKGALCCFWGKTCGKIYYTWKGEWLLKIPGFCDELFTRMTANSSSYHYIPLPLLLARDEVYEEEMKSMKEVFWNCDLLCDQYIMADVASCNFKIKPEKNILYFC